MKRILSIALGSIVFLTACHNDNSMETDIISDGQMPNLAKDKAGSIHLVYGSGDSILYCLTSDGGKTFTKPSLIAVLPKLAASHTRGPQIASTSNGLMVTACNEAGDIFSFTKEQSGKWRKAERVNDVDTVARENLMALASDGDNAFVVWVDLRDRYNKIFGARSIDGGKTWSKNLLVYASPDTTVCSCCKPSVLVDGNNVSVMFRNWLNGNRDLYLTRSSDGGHSFGAAQKLGNESWALNACPMDGGNMVEDKNGNLETVWNRKGLIYACEPGKQEKELGKGRSCTVESVNGKNVYAWVDEGNIVVLEPRGMKKNLGKGQLPILKAVNNEHVLCVWEKDRQIHKAVFEL